MRFPGTITVPEDAFDKVIEYAARSLKQHGFRDIVFLGDHGSYQKEEAAVAQRLDREWAATPARGHAVLEYYPESEHGFGKLRAAQGYSPSDARIQAGLPATSLMMAPDPS